MKLNIVLFIFLFFFGRSSLQAQYSFSDDLVASVNIQTVMVLSITNNSSTSITFNNTAYNNGYTVSNFNTVAIKSNIPWSLAVSSATPFFSASGSGASSNMPASVIGVNKSGQSTQVKLSTTPQALATGNRGNTSQSGNTFNMDFSANPGYSYGPGIYSLTITYTLTAQ